MAWGYDPISDSETSTGLEGWTTARLAAGDPNRGTGLYKFAGASDLERNIAKEQAKRAKSASAGAGAGAGAGGVDAGGPQWGDISGLFREALAGLSGEGEKTYQAGKRRSMSDIAMQSVNAGMANTLNLPSAGIAYDEANRPAFNTMLGQQKANILTGLGQTAAGMYGTNVGAQTSRYGIDVGAKTSLQTANIGAGADLSRTAMGMQGDAAQRELQRYIAGLTNTTANRELSLRAAGLYGQ